MRRWEKNDAYYSDLIALFHERDGPDYSDECLFYGWNDNRY